MCRPIFFTFVSMMVGMSIAHAQTPTKDQLAYIEDFSSRMCEEVKQEGSTSSEKFQGDLKAGLSTFFKKFIDTGASGKAEYSSEEYHGVLQKDLMSALSDVRQCKIHFGDTLLGFLKINEQDAIALHLYPADQPTPQNECSAHAPPGSLILFLGSSTVAATAFPHTVLTVNGLPLIVVDRHPDNSISLNLTVFSEDGREIVRIVDNRFVINQNNYFGLSQPSGKSSLNVESKDGDTVLRVRYYNEAAASIEGVFKSFGRTIPIDPAKMQVGGIVISGFCSIGNRSDIVIGR